MERQESLSPEQSLQLINEMIVKAKRSFSNISFYFLMWGWLLLVAGITEYVLARIVHWEYSWIGWPIVGILGGIGASLHGSRSKSAKGTTYMDNLFMYIWLGFIAMLIVLIVSTVANGINPGPFIMIATGLPTFISGGAMRFRPLIVGGVLFWVIGLLSFFVLEEYSSLLFSLSILCGYIIPGMMLKKAESDGTV